MTLRPVRNVVQLRAVDRFHNAVLIKLRPLFYWAKVVRPLPRPGWIAEAPLLAVCLTSAVGPSTLAHDPILPRRPPRHPCRWRHRRHRGERAENVRPVPPADRHRPGDGLHRPAAPLHRAAGRRRDHLCRVQRHDPGARGHGDRGRGEAAGQRRARLPAGFRGRLADRHGEGDGDPGAAPREPTSASSRFRYRTTRRCCR